MLEEVTTQVDETQARINQLTARVEKLLQDSGYSPCCMVLFLSGVVVFLLLLLILS